MSKSINVTSIVSMYYSSPMKWNREQKKPRACDAIVFFTEGEIQYFFDDKAIVAKRGDILLLPGNLPYSGICINDKNAYFVLNFNCVKRNELARLGAPKIMTVEDVEDMTSRFSETLSMWQEHRINAELQVKSFLYARLAELFQSEAPELNDSRKGDPSSYIRRHYCESNLNISRLCEKFFISESQLRRNVKKTTGYSPNDYITMLRINKAKNELMQSKNSIKQISLDCGFESPYYFSRCFSKHTGMSPKTFRQSFGIT